MQLIELLKTTDKDEYIYLGAASMYLWIAKPEEMIEKLPELDAYYTEKLQCQIKQKTTMIDYYERCLQRVQSHFEAREANRQLEKARRIKREATENLENRIPFAARQIKDVYRRKMVEPFGFCVIIEGGEYGDFWTYDEVEDYKNGCQKAYG